MEIVIPADVTVLGTEPINIGGHQMVVHPELIFSGALPPYIRTTTSNWDRTVSLIKIDKITEKDGEVMFDNDTELDKKAVNGDNEMNLEWWSERIALIYISSGEILEFTATFLIVPYCQS